MATYHHKEVKRKRVQLITIKYGVSEYNPYFNSEFVCLGTIVSIYTKIPYRVYVKWDNGNENDYAMDDLQIINNYQYRSIW